MTRPIAFQFLAVPARTWPLGTILEHADRMVLAVMLDRWRLGDIIAIGSAALVDETGCSESTTDRAIDHLIELELLERVTRGGGRGRPATYRLGRKTLRRLEEDQRRKGVTVATNASQDEARKGGHGDHVSASKGGHGDPVSDRSKVATVATNGAGKGVKKGGYGPPKKVATMTPPSEIRSARAREAEPRASSLASAEAESIRDLPNGVTPPVGAGTPPPPTPKVRVVDMRSGFPFWTTPDKLVGNAHLKLYDDVHGRPGGAA